MVFRRAATAALVVIAVWLVLTFFGNQIVSVVGELSPAAAGEPDRRPRRSPTPSMVAELGRLSPITLFTEMTQALLDPTVQSLDPYFADPDRPGARRRSCRTARACCSSGRRSCCCWRARSICFAAAYVSFMRQEVRA